MVFVFVAVFSAEGVLYIFVGLHDLEGAVRRVEELDLADAPLWHGVERRAAPAPLQQADGLRCRDRTQAGVRLQRQTLYFFSPETWKRAKGTGLEILSREMTSSWQSQSRGRDVIPLIRHTYI